MDWRPMRSFSDFPFVEELCSDLLQSKYCPISLEANHLFNKRVTPPPLLLALLAGPPTTTFNPMDTTVLSLDISSQ
ncbi:hypothetical protein CEXT_407441 [Caerostris extrusa]|uniref:Uncharacterized protein n=1 Tax=Caerostris extrusa TaxID=172846 RepID=A0AAV4QT46_CAEEX|nr:hypothetical protein CEXT_407441 [Caerostris extrusa]